MSKKFGKLKIQELNDDLSFLTDIKECVKKIDGIDLLKNEKKTKEKKND